jgi:hypothetical protein
MAQVQLTVSSEHYQYLKQRAESQDVTLDSLLSEIIEADIAWQETLSSDPMHSLIGQINDNLDTQDIDKVVYRLGA